MSVYTVIAPRPREHFLDFQKRAHPRRAQKPVGGGDFAEVLNQFLRSR